MASGTNVETETLFFDEPMSPAHVEFVVGGFDTWGGARTLDAVDLTLDIVMSATVAAENDSQMPADDLSVFAQLFVLGSVAGDPLDCTNTVEVVSPGLGPSDGVSGSGPDYWEAGFVEVECNSSTTITEDLANYVDGQATVAVIDAIGFYTIFWTPDSTIDVIGFRGEGSLTVDYSYSLVSGACCLPSGDCLDTDILSCDDLGGAFSPGSDCGSHICAQPGACCFPDGSCQEADLVSGDGCVTAGGEYQGPDMPCSSVVCQLPTNACCLNNGMCNDLLEEDCLALGGIPNEGDCVSFFCPQPGACCFPDGSCALAENTNGSDCKQAGGAYQGKNSDCMTVSCPPAIGACCLNDGLCLPTIESACSTTGGEWQGPLTTCDTASCDMPGACCLPDGSCDVASTVDGNDCILSGGSYQGANTNCSVDLCPRRGACCAFDGSCTFVLRTVCEDAGGEFTGEDVTCNIAPCEGPRGACCYQNGVCLDQSEELCLQSGGMFNGYESSCADTACPGACCLLDGTCVPSDGLVDCQSMGGTFQGMNTPCGANVCAPGPCCLPNLQCIEVNQIDCLEQGGHFIGGNGSCGTTLCPFLFGACCLPDGSCEQRSSEACMLVGGEFFGVGSTCNTVDCDEPIGACCLLDGSCENLESQPCGNLGGTWLGIGTLCGEPPCDLPLGACCFGDGSCESLNELDCILADGSYQGADTTCDTADCDQPGACCFPDESCELATTTSGTDCIDAGGAYQGAGTSCVAIDCPPPCVGDCSPVNGDGSIGNGEVNVDDFIAALNAIGSSDSPCDVSPPPNGNGIVNFDDVTTILNNWGPCP